MILDMILIILVQYTVLGYLLLKKKEWVDMDGPFGIGIWIPILGPFAAYGVIYVLLHLAIPILLLLAIPNGVIWVMNRMIKDKEKKIEYIT